MLNTQAPEKRVHHDGSVLSVHSIFHTLQGEGPFCGTPAVFVRLAGCNLQCPLCDTEYTQGRIDQSLNEIVERINTAREGTQTRLVVITGGEPFRQNIAGLLETLIINEGCFVQIETNGTLPPSDYTYNQDISHRVGAFIVCSPKAGAINKQLEEQICAYKYIIGTGAFVADGLPDYPLDHASNPHVARPKYKRRLIYLQPTDYKDEKLNKVSQDVCVRICLQQGYIMQLQTHKILGVE